MSQILLPQRFLTQPQYQVPLDKANKFHSRIKFAYSVGRGANDGAHGLGSVAGTMTYGVGQKGKNVQPVDASSYIAFSDTPDYNITGGVTVIALVTVGGTTVQQHIISKTFSGGGSDTPWAFGFETGGYIFLNRANSGFRVWQSGTALTADRTVVIAATQGADISVAPKFYVDGVLDSVASTNLYGGSGSGAPNSNTETVKIGNRADLGSQFFGRLYDGFVFDIALSDVEVAEFSRNIYSIWKAPERRIWTTASSGVTVALSGQALAGSQGSLGVNTSVALPGQQGSLSSGTLSTAGDAIVALSGQSLSSAQGLLFPEADVSIAGQSLSSSQGGLGVSLDVGLPGQALALSQGAIGTQGDVTVALSGMGMTASQGLLSPPQAPSEGGHFAGVHVVGRKRKKRDLVDRDRNEIRHHLKLQLDEAYAALFQPEIPAEIQEQAATVIKQLKQPGRNDNIPALQQEVFHIRQMLNLWEQQARQQAEYQKLQRQTEEDEELLMMFL